MGVSWADECSPPRMMARRTVPRFAAVAANAFIAGTHCLARASRVFPVCPGAGLLGSVSAEPTITVMGSWAAWSQPRGDGRMSIAR